jgi:hypothetical protein
MSTASIRDVELVKVGTWAASTGVTTVTRDDLTAMVTAYADGLVDKPVIKIGHDDDNEPNSPLGDGEPAYGWVGNVRLSDDGSTLLGDLVGMPGKLAEVAPTAWRRRSVEIAWGVKTAGGKSYRAVLTGLALLGVQKPAVKGLADVLALYSHDSHDDYQAQKVTVFTMTTPQSEAPRPSQLSELGEALRKRFSTAVGAAVKAPGTLEENLDTATRFLAEDVEKLLHSAVAAAAPSALAAPLVQRPATVGEHTSVVGAPAPPQVAPGVSATAQLSPVELHELHARNRSTPPPLVASPAELAHDIDRARSFGFARRYDDRGNLIAPTLNGRPLR